MIAPKQQHNDVSKPPLSYLHRDFEDAQRDDPQMLREREDHLREIITRRVQRILRSAKEACHCDETAKDAEAIERKAVNSAMVMSRTPEECIVDYAVETGKIFELEEKVRRIRTEQRSENRPTASPTRMSKQRTLADCVKELREIEKLLSTA